MPLRPRRALLPLLLAAAALAVLAATGTEAVGAGPHRKVVRDLVRPEALRDAAVVAAGGSRSRPGASSSAAAPEEQRHGGNTAADKLTLPEPKHFGFLDVNRDKGSNMYYMYYEASEPAADPSTTPIVLWLQGGPGCSSLFGMVYINGPYFVNDDLTLRPNPGSWSRLYGMLFIEQPIGVGWSSVGTAKIPDNELDVAWDLYRALQNFYGSFPAYKDRPLIVTGESYAGKYVPSLAHFILQADAFASGYVDKLLHTRDLPSDVEPPLFKLAGLAIGNGYTDAETQTAYQAEVAYGMGLISWHQRKEAEKMQDEVIELIQAKEYRKARVAGDALMAFITDASGSATLEDIRRNTGYDGSNMADAFLNQPHVRAAINAPDVFWVSCSAEVDQIMRHDVMKSVKNLVIDLLAFKPVLLYQGQFDAECGVAGNDAWISTLSWPGHTGFSAANRTFWMVNDHIAGYLKQHDTLTHLVVRNTGHMVPHDNPLYGQLFLERWVEEEVLGRGPYVRDGVTPQLESDWANLDQGQYST